MVTSCNLLVSAGGFWDFEEMPGSRKKERSNEADGRIRFPAGLIFLNDIDYNGSPEFAGMRTNRYYYISRKQGKARK
jgi:hypothetical protein